MSTVKGKSVLITGASRGIGEAAAREFAARGAKVLLTARSGGEIERIADEITAAGGTAAHLSVDVTDLGQVYAAADMAISKFGRLDVLINNAGVIDPIERLEDADPEEWNRLIDINVKGVFHGIHAALPRMKAVSGGTIITIGSGAATNALEGWSAYCTSKAAVHHLNRALHEEESENGIRAMVLSPGTVATDMQVTIRDSGINPVSRMEWSRHISPEWVGKALVWMCTEDAEPWKGSVVYLREPDIRRRVGLTD